MLLKIYVLNMDIIYNQKHLSMTLCIVAEINTENNGNHGLIWV
mgnify:CR=1 FL=1|jgi:hypothetical protein